MKQRDCSVDAREPHDGVTPRVCAHSILSFQAPEMPSTAMQLRRRIKAERVPLDLAADKADSGRKTSRKYSSERVASAARRIRAACTPADDTGNAGNQDLGTPRARSGIPTTRLSVETRPSFAPQHRLAELGNATHHVDFGMRQFAHARCSFNPGALCSASFGFADVAARLGSILRARSAFRMTATSISSCSKAPCTGVK